MRGSRSCAVPLALILVACGSGGSGSGKRAEATTTTDQPATTRPTVSTIAPATSQQEYTTEDLEKLLVPLHEVPSGFRLQIGGDDDDETQVCDANPFPRMQRTARADVAYVSGQVALLSEQLTSYGSEKQAEAVMRNARAAYEVCKTFDMTDSKGVVTHYVVAPMSFDRLADDQAAFRLSFKRAAVSGTADFVAARVGDLIMVTAGLSASSTPGSSALEPGDFTSFTKTAYTRIT